MHISAIYGRLGSALLLAMIVLVNQASGAADPSATAPNPGRPVNKLPRPWSEMARRPLLRPPAEPNVKVLDVPTKKLSISGYTHFSTMAETPDHRLHLFSFFGEQHQSGHESSIVYRSSSNGGLDWTAPTAILDGRSKGIDWRICAAGVTATGRLLLVAVRLELAAQTALLGSIHSDDGGGTWSPFTELVQYPPSLTHAKGSQMLPNGQIKVTIAGRLIMMAYLGAWNFSLTSDDNGRSWVRTVITKSEQSYSEMAVEPLDEENWISVTRIDRGKSSMAQFVTHDGGRTWLDLGPLNIPSIAGYVMPSLNLVHIDGRAFVVLGVADRATGRGTFRIGDAASVGATARTWGSPRIFAASQLMRSGYQTAVVDQRCGRLVVANHRETSERDTTLEITLVPISALFDEQDKFPHVSAACATFH